MVVAGREIGELRSLKRIKEQYDNLCNENKSLREAIETIRNINKLAARNQELEDESNELLAKYKDYNETSDRNDELEGVEEEKGELDVELEVAQEEKAELEEEVEGVREKNSVFAEEVEELQGRLNNIDVRIYECIFLRFHWCFFSFVCIFRCSDHFVSDYKILHLIGSYEAKLNSPTSPMSTIESILTMSRPPLPVFASVGQALLVVTLPFFELQIAE